MQPWQNNSYGYFFAAHKSGMVYVHFFVAMGNIEDMLTYIIDMVIEQQQSLKESLDEIKSFRDQYA